MAKHGPKNVFMSDMGSNFWPLATKYATIPDSEIKGLPPMWKRLLTKDIGVLNSHGGYLWLLFSTDQHESVSRVEKMVHKIKLYLKKSQVLNQFLTPNFTSTEMETILSSLVTTINTRPLAIYKNEILTPQSYYFHTFKMSPISDSTIPIINPQKPHQKIKLRMQS